jgi:hypothetical protein
MGSALTLRQRPAAARGNPLGSPAMPFRRHHSGVTSFIHRSQIRREASCERKDL